MKKIFTMLCGSLIVLLLFVGSGNVALAHEGDGCGCVVEPVFGVEKNKIVAELLKSNEFKSVKATHEINGFTFMGAENIQVVYNITEKIMMVGVPFNSKDGTVIMSVFFDGIYMDPTLLNVNAKE